MMIVLRNENLFAEGGRTAGTFRACPNGGGGICPTVKGLGLERRLSNQSQIRIIGILGDYIFASLTRRADEGRNIVTLTMSVWVLSMGLLSRLTLQGGKPK